MKQTDKCECTHFEKKKRKSHSQTGKLNVRASEEENKSFCLSNESSKSSSVPYTPLDKNNVFMTPFNNVGFYKDEYVLSALNGYLDDISGNLPHGKDYVIAKELLNKWFPILDEVNKEVKRIKKCKHCKGTGLEPTDSDMSCLKCNGKGEI